MSRVVAWTLWALVGSAPMAWAQPPAVTPPVAAPAASPAKDLPGRVVFTAYRCHSCHAVKTLGIERVLDDKDKDDEDARNAPDLSAPGEPRNAGFVRRFLLREEQTKSGKKHKKKFRGDDVELEQLVAFALALR